MYFSVFPRIVFFQTGKLEVIRHTWMSSSDSIVKLCGTCDTLCYIRQPCSEYCETSAQDVRILPIFVDLESMTMNFMHATLGLIMRGLRHIFTKGPLHKGLSLLIPRFNSSYPCTKPITIAHQTFLSPPCHKKYPCFVRGIAQSASSRLNVGVKCPHRLELPLW